MAQKANFLQVYQQQLKEMIIAQVDRRGPERETPLKGLKVVVNAGNGMGGFLADMLHEVGKSRHAVGHLLKLTAVLCHPCVISRELVRPGYDAQMHRLGAGSCFLSEASVRSGFVIHPSTIHNDCRRAEHASRRSSPHSLMRFPSRFLDRCSCSCTRCFGALGRRLSVFFFCRRQPGPR